MLLSSGIYAQTRFNFERVSRSELNIENKSRSNPLPWKGQFSPQLIQVLLHHFADENSIVFDPFLGSGTVLYEAGRAKLTASGTEINPAAVALAQAYHFINVSVADRRVHLRKVETLLQDVIPLETPLFTIGQNVIINSDELKLILIDAIDYASDRWQVQLLETLITLLDFYQPDLSTDKIYTVWHNLKRTVISLPFSKRDIAVFHADARNTPLPDASVNFVITSPPYINVFNYHQQYRASMEALNWNILRVARSEIGSNRKHRGNRFLTVIQYCLDMAQTFQELARVCQPTARIIFVVGRESKVRSTPFGNGEIVAEIATRALGSSLILKQERVFQNRFGNNIYEDILHFTRPVVDQNGADALDTARQIANEALEAALQIAPDKAKEDIQLALQNIEQVYPSPTFDLAHTLE
jgi:tRNA G10  N-methylase Trm11